MLKKVSHSPTCRERQALMTDPLSFRPNPAAFASASSSKKTSSARPSRDDDASKDVYRPPRIAAVPYEEPSSSRRDRRAPALLSEFAHTMDGAPVLESTTGLSVRPVQKDRHTNSLSAKRAAELERLDKFEEENLTRLVTTKREEKRRREDEAALSMGYGVGGTGRGKGRRQNGLEAELEGVLGDRRSKGLWEGVKKDLGQRESVLERGKKRGSAPTEVRNKKARFDKDVKGHAKKAKRT
jgi:U3 small nucleolar ribonucleoprotein protein LCP5